MPSAAGALGLDEVIVGLETNGVLVDRPAAVSAGLHGILLSIDPNVEFGAAAPPDGVNKHPEVSPRSSVVAVELWPGNLAYLKVSDLNRGSGTEILEHLKALSACWGVLLDVRGSGGEDLESVCILAGLVRNLDEPLFTVTDNRGSFLETNVVLGAFAKMPLLMILIDEKTSGSAEAMAFVFKGSPGVLLVGATTKGDFCLRTWVPLPDGGMARLRTRKWGPVRRTGWENGGISPDISVISKIISRYSNAGNADLGQKYDADRDLIYRVDRDPALQRATDMLLGLQALGDYGCE